MYLLDTDISSYILRERPIEVLERFQKLDATQLGISVITEAELLYGVARSKSKKVNKSVVESFTSRLVIFEWDSLAAEAYGTLRAKLEAKGTPIGNMDMMIAAHAISLGATLVSNNEKHFKKVPKLKLENWVSP